MASPQTGSRGSDDPQLQLLEALLRNDLPAFQQLLGDARVNPHHQYSQPIKGSCLEVAAASGREDFVRVLLRAYSSRAVDARPTAAHRAAQGGHARALRVLVAGGGDAAAGDALGRTPLHYVCHFASLSNMAGYEECVNILLRYFSTEDLNREDKFGYSAIHIAAASDVQGFPEDNILGSPSHTARGNQDTWRAKRRIIEVLLCLAADVIDVDSSRVGGLSAREAIINKFPHVQSLLPIPNNCLSTDPHIPLIQALRNDNILLFRAHLHKIDADCNPELDPNHSFGAPIHATVLELACSTRGGAQFVRMLLDCGADPELPSKLNMKFPIHIVCERGDPASLTELLSAENRSWRVDVNSTDAVGNTALHYIARGNQNSLLPCERADFLSCLSILIAKAELDVNIMNEENETPLHVALQHDNREFVCEILTKLSSRVNLDLDCQVQNLRERIPAIYPDLKELLPPPIQNRSIVQFRDENQLLDLLKKRKVDDFIRILNRYSQRELSNGDQYNTPLQYACRFGLSRAVKSLLECGADPNATTHRNQSPPLLLASYYGHTEVLRHLLDTRVPLFVNRTDPKGNSALHYAAQRHDLESVILLLKHGANWEIKNNLRKMPFDGNVKELLDECVKTNEQPPHSENYEVIFDYRLFTAMSLENYTSDTNMTSSSRDNLITDAENNNLIQTEMYMFPILMHYSNGPELLNHPVVASFLHMKWSRVRLLVFAKIVSLIQYLILLNIHIVLYSNAVDITYYFAGHHDSSERFYPHPVPATSWPIFLGTVFSLIWEIIQAVMECHLYWKNYENIMDLATYFLALWIVVPPAFVEGWMVHPCWSWVFVLVIMVSTFNLFLLTARIRPFARNIELFKVVMVRYIKTFVSYFILFLAFALSFHVVFRTVEATKDSGEPNRFKSIAFTFVKVLTMMTGEFDSASLPLESTTTGTILFVVFVLAVTIVLLNLLIGVAVSDMDTIQDDAEKRWLKIRIRTVMDVEMSIVRIYNSWLCRCVRRCCSERCTAFLLRALLFPRCNTPHEARISPSAPRSIRLDASAERPMDPEITRHATALLRQRTASQLEGARGLTDAAYSAISASPHTPHHRIEGVAGEASTC